MVCKNCNREIDEDSIFCKWCGEKQIRERRKKAEVRVPKPRQLASGEYIGQIMIDGHRHTVKGATLAEYEAKCRAYKAGVVEVKRGAAGVSVGELVDSYLLKNSNVLSPSTLRGYKTIRKTAFQVAMGKDALKLARKSFVHGIVKSRGISSGFTFNSCWGQMFDFASMPANGH